MSYVEYCAKHGEYKGDYCGDCIEEMQEECSALRRDLASAIKALEFYAAEENPIGKFQTPDDWVTLVAKSGNLARTTLASITRKKSENE